MNRLCRIFFLIFFIAAVLSWIPVTHASWQPEISVGLMSRQREVSFTGSSGVLHVYTSLEKKPILTLPQGKPLVISLDRDTFGINGVERKSSQIIIQSPDGGIIQVNGAPYRGYITLLRKDGMTVVNNVLVEDYLYGVVPKEMPSNWSAEALRAQSVAARTFALKNRGRYSEDGYDLCNTSRCQVYEGMTAETKATTSAVDATRGEVLFYHGVIADALFHTDSGGMTESSENVWGNYIPYLRAVPEIRIQTQPWSRTIPSAFFVQKIEEDAKKIGKLKEIKASPLQIGVGKGDRSISGRLLTVRIIGDKGTVTLEGNKIRTMFALPSTLFNIRVGKSSVEFNGYGSGHGLGMSQWGAKAYADKGKNYKDILRYYYTGVTIEKLY